ncbi:AlbA family DNA-binding domain-containing protein [Cryobacterium luteum]|uniref:ATP-binding protein n=1 Tax=Cryobacterium luteum TaxID=1424661 RepID=A0A1H8JLF7_9MICO|nr:ATP-binding protein [Cryobacterium luteum]TFB83914.1 ATP-binding protein [Cryobacterium luteum]SEN81499.1 Putative DNA-binding domain-containing protein [Cryobacterium luteum]
MNFTPLHRALGLTPRPLTDEILDSAVDVGVTETDDLDWKSELPPIKNLSQTDVPKDIAAMANSGGGMIVYGVAESQKAATGRKDVGEFTEGHERAYRSAAVTAISPPVFGLGVYRLGMETHAVAVVVPASVDGPHLVYKNDLFGAPIRNDADTAWMKERQIEVMYRARFEERRRSSDAVNALYDEAAEGRDSQKRAWFVAVAHPRIPSLLSRPDRHETRAIFARAETVSLSYSNNHGVHPLESMDRLNPRPGLRRWTAVNKANAERERWKEAWADVHHDGSVMLAAAIGGHRRSADAYFDGWEVEGRGLEGCIADFAGLVRAVAEAQHLDEYEVRVGVAWNGEQPLQVLDVDGRLNLHIGTSTTLRRFESVRSTINAAGSNESFHRDAFRLAEDCVNQGGITLLHMMKEPPANDDD